MDDEIVMEAARLLGYKRAGQKLAEQIRQSISRLIKGRQITAGACGIRLS